MQDRIVVEKGKPGNPQPDPHRALVERIASSPTFQKSNRLQELLLFLCERTIADPGVVVREQEIGVELFGRPAGYDTSQDTLVRTQVYQLRKKLERHFATDGRHEEIVIDIPKGAYTPVFHKREQTTAPPSNTAATFARPKVNRVTVFFAALATAGLASTLFLALRGDRDGSARLQAGFGPQVDRLWSEMFGNGRPTRLVLADSDLAFFSEIIGRQIDLHQYMSKDFTRMADESAATPGERNLAKMVMRWFDTSFADAALAAKIGALSALRRIPLEVVPARDFEMAGLKLNNVILIGGTRSNPWVELFNDRLKYFAPGKPKWGFEGYCRVAYLANLSGSGNILMISGTDQASVGAGGELLTHDNRVRQLRSALGLSDGDRTPYFEVLLKVQVLASSAPRFEIVAQRILK